MLCQKIFATWSQLTTHSQEEHKEQKEYECNVCGDKQGTANGHHKHMLSHKEVKLKFTCKFSQKKFPYKCYLKLHMNVHSDEKPYSCVARGCNFMCKLRQSLTRHMVVHLGVEFSCLICPKEFSKKHY